MLARLLRPVVQLREGEATTVLLMFLYSFLAMAGYNMIKPVTRGLFIEKLGADNLPWIQFGAGIVIGFIMQGYTRAIGLAPRRWMIPITLSGIVIAMATFWALFGQMPQSRVVAVAFYLFGLIIGILLISQFWTLANDVYDPRQAKRIFGFIGAGSSLGGFAGATMTSTVVERIGTNSVLLVSAVTLAVCTLTVAWVVSREPAAGRSDASKTGEEGGVSGSEAIRLLRSSKHLQTIAMVIGFAAIGAAIIEQQLNMAAAESKGAQNVDAVTGFLAQITAYLSIIGFLVQVLLTSRIHRFLGIGFALMILPVVDSVTGMLMLFNGALWTAGLARIMDTSLRYTVDKTTREILFLPLPVDVKYQAKPFIDVTVDRVAKGLGALMLLVLVQDWGLDLGWRQLSYASVTMMVIWGAFALTARREYMAAFRRSIEQQDVRPAELRLDSADLSSIETLLTELSHEDPRRVIYAIDMLEALDKRQLVTPLLLRHDSPEVRTRALRLARYTDQAHADRWLPGVERALADEDGEVRLAAARALATLRGEAAVDVMRPYLDHHDPNLVVTAAAALAGSDVESDADKAYEKLKHLASEAGESSAELRRQVARALGLVTNSRFRPLLVPLLYDDNYFVARAAVNSAGTIGGDDFLYVPTLVSLMRNRRLKEPARKVLVGYGEAVVPTLAYFLGDQEEDLWVRRHVPSTLARIPSDASVQALITALDGNDGFLRFKAITALERIHADHPELAINREAIEKHVLAEAGRAFSALTLYTNLFSTGTVSPTALLARVLEEKRKRAVDRVFQLLGLISPARDVSIVSTALKSPEARHRSSALELLDNMLTGEVRRRVMLLVDDMPADERVRRGNVIYKTRARDLEDSLAQLVHDDNQIVAAAAILLIEEKGLWSLSDDLEHVLEHRDARDWQVFEAASWALAASRMPAERRRQIWKEPLPTVVLVDILRRLPLFDFTSVDELFRIAALGAQVRHEAGRLLYARGTAPATLQFVLDGHVEIAPESGPPDTKTAPAPLAFEEILEGHPMRSSVRALEPTISLSIGTEAFLSLLAENVELAEGMMRWIIESRAELGSEVLIPGQLSAEVQRKAASGLQAIDRVLLLQGSPLLRAASGAQLLRFAACARPVTLKAGADPLAHVTEPSMLIVLTGTITVTRPDGTRQTADSGDTIGMYQALSGKPLGATLSADGDSTALRFTRADLFDVLADETALIQSVFAGLLRAAERRAEEAALAR
ncbi:MAG TPA: MFS transporter [Vicinamibacterales bacterium]|nr:MFS transporter [Vicinamibacterales bacterium]